MTRDESSNRAAELIQQAKDTRACTAGIQERMLETVLAVASTEEQVAGTLDSLARDRPDRAARLTALSTSARKNAAYGRQWAEDHST